ncbi:MULTISPECIES: ShlB/FhaC/HecB family hemolysin secretion/activation protein [Cyanophyceae]|uniref:ShlB/FhaC/HecB family hemolysin secretion/activation protein n=1 Tax=Leptolyngbya subtilissima DQ-A4 TaxID=2933933 RepID=A0ABV0K953_9CYAN|nr:ShlB/FhaC/HecB family hemolysin secretion/activation protein [Nodosilinea sp. FACHB-141]MBD2110337.1 ShlB/FhaC/HecB family hemolysin secretion/activation protein [Nodosilinea sp. FACHB-141]
MMHLFPAGLGALIVVLAFNLGAQAQTPPDLPEPTGPSRPAPLNPPLPEPIPPEEPLLRPEPNPEEASPPAGELVFTVNRIEVVGNTVLEDEIAALVEPWEGNALSLADLLELRTAITELYQIQGYVTSGAFLPTNQDLGNGVVQIQVIEGGVETIQVNGLGRLREGYVRDRIALATQSPLQIAQVEDALRLLQIDPLLERVDAELTAGSRPGQNILILDVAEADPFSAAVTLDNSQSSSIGSWQAEAQVQHRNVLGLGDAASLRYGHTQGLNLYELRYGLPLNARDGTLQVRYENASSRIVTPQFVDAGIRSNSQTLALSVRQPLSRSISQEFALGLAFDLRQSRSFILNDIPFSFSVGPENGVAKVSALRFSQDWLARDLRRVVAARSQFSLGLGLFDATVNDTGTDGRFFAWLGQFQWVERVSPNLLLVSRVNAQLTPNSLLPLERFSVGGQDTVRGYAQNQIVTDNAVVGSVELRIPLSATPNQLLLIPFVDAGTGWNTLTESPTPSVLLGTGLGVQWQPIPAASLGFTYGIPLIGVPNRGSSWQENGFYFTFTYQPL